MTRPLWVKLLLLLIMLTNAADLILTLWGIRLGVIAEANPLMAPLIRVCPGLAALIKLTAAGCGCGILYWAYPRQRPLVTTGLLVIAAAMATVMGLHSRWLIQS